MRAEVSALFRDLSPRAGVCVADGYGIRVFVRRGHLVVSDGIGRHRRERRFARATAGIRRVIVHGHEGFVTLEALRWMADLGIAFIQIDRDGKLIGASAPPGNDDARLRRAQALARDSDLGLEVARWILDLKLSGQSRVLAVLDAHKAQSAVAAARRGLAQVASTEELMSTPEARAAAAYWEAWASLPIQFVGKDQARVPEQWKTFSTRRSPLSGSPRLAANPANSILNYLYRLLEAETRLACAAVGLDPGLGFFHKDKRGRDNLVMDLMEACRPEVDAYALRLFQTYIFRAADFHETRKGVCRVLPPLTHELAATATLWARAVAPVAETVAGMLGKPLRRRKERPPTPLTGSNRSRGRDPFRKGSPRERGPANRLASRTCRECGAVVASRTRAYCDSCLRNASSGDTGLKTGLKKAAASVRQQEALSEWRDVATGRTDPEVFRRDILPALRRFRIREIAEKTGLSEAYCYKIRRGDFLPHERHWLALSQLTERES